MAAKDNVQAERLFREALAIYTAALPAGHLNIAIARIKLGRTLLRQKRYADAETEVAAGYTMLNKQVNPSASWLKSARADLAEIAAYSESRATRIRASGSSVTTARRPTAHKHEDRAAPWKKLPPRMTFCLG